MKLLGQFFHIQGFVKWRCVQVASEIARSESRIPSRKRSTYSVEKEQIDLQSQELCTSWSASQLRISRLLVDRASSTSIRPQIAERASKAVVTIKGILVLPLTLQRRRHSVNRRGADVIKIFKASVSPLRIMFIKVFSIASVLWISSMLSGKK